MMNIKLSKKDTKVTSSHEFIIFSWNNVCEICENVNVFCIRNHQVHYLMIQFLMKILSIKISKVNENKTIL